MAYIGPRAPKPPTRGGAFYAAIKDGVEAAMKAVAREREATHPQPYVEDMYRPDCFGRTASGTVEVTK